ncbi:SusC/RagA family TonB-linked outer membrane protein [Dokdonia donghaensis]|uniref:TonB-dependent receptor n=1 Tax=Dokdonia donghaensis DSW-1 TaxID=1300343 RepID=A0A0A2GY60_9FLAO|nr:SusC/RagA family TonB-linked outer membrane protein [Dokdonia donghaensis]ANH60174.1 catecholate siderophore receptor CirA [Dokdonia donghaensis DSW-1]KGO07463.1 TonB-dependent receptor [Dokdonia donghaensis DSW-1]
MKTKFSGILTLLLAFVVQVSFAQTTVSGTVTEDNGPLPGANVIIKGTSTGTQTDFDGNYSIQASPSDVLVFSFVGFATQEVTVGNQSTINVALAADNALDEVVVTAQGVKREKKALGYAVSEVASEEIEGRTEGDVARVLSGKASGVQITSQSGASGSATNVIIRGYTSINGSNQALFVVDGVPFSSDTNTSGDFLNGNNGSSRFLDLDPNNIESVNVLKGLAAATLYGTAGRNGVIVITTKSGTTGNGGPKKSEITINQSYFVNEIASLPDYQDSYGGGFDQSFGWFFSNWGPSFNAGGVDGYLNDPAQLIDENGTVAHPYDTQAAFNGSRGDEFAGQRYEYRPYNNVSQFFRTGGVSNTSININGASEDGKVNFNVNYGHLEDKGFIPGNQLRRNNLSVGGRAQLSNKFTIAGTMNFSRTDVSSPPVAASRGNGTLGFSVFANVFFTPRNVDLAGLPFDIPETGGSLYYRNGNDINNPNWIVRNAGSKELTNRVYGTSTLSYAINDNLNLQYRAGVDFYNSRFAFGVNKGGVLGSAGVDDINGEYNTRDTNVRIWDHYVALSGDYDLSDKIGMTFVTGATSRSRNIDVQGVNSTGQLVFGIQRHFNFLEQTPVQFTSFRNIVGVLGQADIDYDNMLFLTLAARNDWVSNLPKENNSKFYPSVSLSFLPTTAFDGLKGDALNYLKVRAGLGTSAGFPTGFPTVNTVSQFTNQFIDPFSINNVTTNSVSNFQANPDLKPELVSEFEVGFDARFLKNRVSLDLSYFNRSTDDLIVTKPLPPSTGFTSTQANVGKVEGDGFEIDLGVDVFESESDGFTWNSRINFTTSEQIVTEQEDDQIIYAGRPEPFLGGNAAIRGEQLGVIVGTRIQRDDNGNFVVNGAGNYVVEDNVTLADGRNITPIIGNPNPDYVMNWINSFSYKNFNLGFQMNHTKGGDIASSTIAVLLGRGLITETEDRENTYILPGVTADGSPNQTQINNSQYYFSNVLFGPKELQIYDASVLRLQEVSLGYSVPKKLLEKTPFGSFSVTASGFNLWYDAYNTPDGANFDPNVAGVGVGNGRGFDYINGPSSKRYGVSVKASF